MAIGQRPCKLVGIKGSRLEMLLFDAAVLKVAAQDKVPSDSKNMSTRDAIMQRRRLSGVYT